MSDLVGNPEDRFSRVAAHIMGGTHENKLQKEVSRFLGCDMALHCTSS